MAIFRRFDRLTSLPPGVDAWLPALSPTSGGALSKKTEAPFVQILELPHVSGVLKTGTVALDGTRMLARQKLHRYAT